MLCEPSSVTTLICRPRLAGRLAVPWLVIACLTACTIAPPAADTADQAATPTGQAVQVRDADQWSHGWRLPATRVGAYWLLDVEVDGRAAGRWLVDTGSSITAIDAGVAARLRLPRDGRGQTVGIAGTETLHWHPVDRVAVGPVELAAERVAGLSLTRLLAGRRAPLSGIVGYDALLPAVFTLDPQTDAVLLHPAGHRPDSATPHRLLPMMGLPMVRASIGEDRDPVYLVIDSGMDRQLTLPPAVAARYPELVVGGATGPGASRGIGGEVQHTRAWLEQLEIFGRTLEHLPVQFEPPPQVIRNDPRLIGRIGAGLLQDVRLTFDARRGRVWAQWLDGP